CRSHARARYWSKYGDIQRRARSFAKALAVSARTAACVPSPAGTEGRHRRYRFFGARDRGLSPTESVARGLGRIPRNVVHSLWAWRPRSRASSGCVGKLLRPFRSESLDGANFLAGRRQARRATGTGFELRVLEKQIRLRSGHRGENL